MENLFLQKNPLQDFLSSLNAVISTNESTELITGHVIYNPAYTYKFQLKTTLVGAGIDINLEKRALHCMHIGLISYLKEHKMKT